MKTSLKDRIILGLTITGALCSITLACVGQWQIGMAITGAVSTCFMLAD